MARIDPSCALERNEYVSKIYQIRDRWAKFYLCKNFFARVRAMQCCEKINSSLKMHLDGKMCLFEFVGTFECVCLSLLGHLNKLSIVSNLGLLKLHQILRTHQLSQLPSLKLWRCTPMRFIPIMSSVWLGNSCNDKDCS